LIIPFYIYWLKDREKVTARSRDSAKTARVSEKTAAVFEKTAHVFRETRAVLSE
jgi:hypothetical protein